MVMEEWKQAAVQGNNSKDRGARDSYQTGDRDVVELGDTRKKFRTLLNILFFFVVAVALFYIPGLFISPPESILYYVYVYPVVLVTLTVLRIIKSHRQDARYLEKFVIVCKVIGIIGLCIFVFGLLTIVIIAN